MSQTVELEMSDLPSVLFISSSDTRPECLIKMIFNTSELNNKIYIEKGIAGYRWRIDNKYYSADVNLCSMSEPILVHPKFASTVQGVVLHFDSTKNNALKDVDFLLDVVGNCSPEIKILVTKNISNEDVQSVGCCKKNVLEWCIEKGFELVELEPTNEEDDSDTDNDFPESTGIHRIIQALNAHVWPNLIMKTKDSKSKGANEKAKFSSDFQNIIEKLNLDESLEELDQEDDFSQLFSQLSVLKERMSSLSGREKKDAAEQVVKAFWNALGDDDFDDESGDCEGDDDIDFKIKN